MLTEVINSKYRDAVKNKQTNKIELNIKLLDKRKINNFTSSVNVKIKKNESSNANILKDKAKPFEMSKQQEETISNISKKKIQNYPKHDNLKTQENLKISFFRFVLFTICFCCKNTEMLEIKSQIIKLKEQLDINLLFLTP